MNSKLLIITLAFFFCSLNSLMAQIVMYDDNEAQVIYYQVRLMNKIVPLSNPVYRVLDHYEATGKIGFLPQAKPYTKAVVLDYLKKIKGTDDLTEDEKKVIKNYISDLSRESNGIHIKKESLKNNSFALVGFAAESTVRMGVGKDGTWLTSFIAEPYVSGDIGEHLTFHASMGPAIEKLAPDIFYQSYTKDKQVNFPSQSVGYAYLPYQFNYETMYTHVNISNKSAGRPNISNEMTVGMYYFTELNGSWYDGALQISMNNQRRSWGHSNQNLTLSSTARRFPAFEMKIEPTSWFRYSYLTGSLFSYANQSVGYKQNIYGYDIGDSQNLFTLHQIEFTPSKWLQISASAGNIWSKRFEVSYLMPFVFSHFSQLEVGDFDNSTMSVDVAFQIPKLGKAWASFFTDEFSFSTPGPLFRIPRNRYAWQLGLKTALPSGVFPGTTSTLKYTRSTPFVYTHYSDNRFNTYTTRPLDMTYTHDEFNLGFYLPPNSGELNWTLENIAIPDLILTLDNRFILHGTNDLSSANKYQIYGDIYRYSLNDSNAYPLLNFTKDGIYDWTVSSEFKFDKKIRNPKRYNYFRLVGSVGFGGTWWVSNSSGVVCPAPKTIFTGSLGVIVDI